MLTVADLQRERQAKAVVNHETYKQLLQQVQRLLRGRADAKATDLLWPVPPLVPGRPVYTVSHAARYVADKLRRGGFHVVTAAPQPDVHVLYITWSATPQASSSSSRKGRSEDRRDRRTPPADTSQALEKLKARLRLG